MPADRNWLGNVADVWIAASTLATAIFAWLGWRVARHSFLLNVPYLGFGTMGSVNLRLWGSEADKWEIAKVRILKPRHATFAVNEPQYDEAGGIEGYAGPPLGRSLDSPGQGFAIVSPADAVTLSVTIRLKSEPKVAKRRVIVIKRAA